VKRALFAMGGALVALAACGGANSLGGSVSELFPLDISKVEVLRNDEAFQVNYYANRGTGVDLVAKVTVATQDLDLSAGKSIPLDGEYAPGHPRTTVIHLAQGEPVRVLPLVGQGDLKIDKGGQVGEETEGDFSMSFQAGDYGGGRNLYGSFKAMAQDAGFGPDGDAPQTP